MPPPLFKVYIDALMRKVTEGSICGVMVGREREVDLEFADDVALLAVSWVVMVAMGMKMEQVTQRFGIDISVRKSEVLFIGRGEGNVRIGESQLKRQPMKQVEELTYLDM